MKNKIRENLILIVILVLLVSTVRVEAAQQKAYMIRNGRLCDMNGSPYTGWRVENGKKFYYDNGKSCKGWKKIGRQYYYFYGKNGLAKNKIVGSKKKRILLCGQKRCQSNQ